MEYAIAAVTTVIIGLTVVVLSDIVRDAAFPSLAEWICVRACRRLPGHYQTEHLRIYLAELDMCRSKWFQVFVALTILLRIRDTAKFLADVEAANEDAGSRPLPADPDPTPVRLSVGQRIVQVFPGLIVWVLIVFVVVSPLLVGQAVVVGALIVVDLYWLVRSIIVVRGILKTHRGIRNEVGEDWIRRCQELPAAAWTDADGGRWDPRDIYHAALIPFYTERYEVLKAAVQALADAEYPAERKLVAVITRTTDTQGIENVQRLQREHEGDFKPSGTSSTPCCRGSWWASRRRWPTAARSSSSASRRQASTPAASSSPTSTRTFASTPGTWHG